MSSGDRLEEIFDEMDRLLDRLEDPVDRMFTLERALGVTMGAFFRPEAAAAMMQDMTARILRANGEVHKRIAQEEALAKIDTSGKGH